MRRSETSAKAPEALDCRVVLARESHLHYWAESRKTTHFDIFHQTATNLPEFFRPCCVCSPRFKLCLYARALFVHVFLWRSVGQASVTQALLWLVHQQSRSFQGLPTFEDWDTKFGQIKFSQGPHIQGYILLKMYKN